MISIFEYTDYRQYLSAYYREKKAENSNFSHRYIAMKVGLKSSGHFAQILTGRVNISTGLISSFSEFLKLKKKESEYFEQMVLFSHAKTHNARKRYLERMLKLRGKKPALLDAAQYEFFSKWYYTAVREVIGMIDFSGDYQELTKLVQPRIKLTEARESIALLEKLRLIQKDEKGIYRKVDSILSTGYEVTSVALENFQIDMMGRAGEAIDRFPREERSLSTLTVGVSQKEYDEIIEELRAFRRRVLDIASGGDKAERIYQFNFQIFPLSESMKA